jgi:hypothetical protein
MQVDPKGKTQTLTTTLSPFQPFHRTPYGYARETTIGLQREIGNSSL